MLTNNLGYPRIGKNREIKKACESYWNGNLPLDELLLSGKKIRSENWKLQKGIGIGLIPSNDFSFYDQILDMCLLVGAIPKRYQPVLDNKKNSQLDLYFAMARGYQKDGLDITAMEMLKWFDTNYHYMVPEFYKGQKFSFYSKKVVDEFKEALEQGIQTKPVLIGPISFLLLGKAKETDFDKILLKGTNWHQKVCSKLSSILPTAELLLRAKALRVKSIINKSTTQSIHQSINQSINQSIK